MKSKAGSSQWYPATSPATLKAMDLNDLHALQRMLIVDLIKTQSELSDRYEVVGKRKPAILLGSQHLMDLNGILESERVRIESAFQL